MNESLKVNEDPTPKYKVVISVSDAAGMNAPVERVFNYDSRIDYNAEVESIIESIQSKL